MSGPQPETTVDDLVSAMTYDASLSDSAVYSEHPRFKDYKNVDKIAQKQKARREEILQRQKNKRGDMFNRGRDLVDEADEFMDYARADESNVFKNSARTLRLNKRYKDCLMLSEWLIDIPEELGESWAMVVCPVGKRCLLAAENGNTTVYNKIGLRLTAMPTGLAGGCALSHGGQTIIDCISVKHQSQTTYYVLDVLAAQGMSFMDVEASMRFAVVNAVVEEAAVTGKGLRNPPRFVVAPRCRSSKQEMAALVTSCFDFEVDGLLFYKDQGFYVSGYTPLVGWLKPWMLPEILKVPIPSLWQATADAQVPIQKFVEEYNERHHHHVVRGQAWEEKFEGSGIFRLKNEAADDRGECGDVEVVGT